MDLASYGRHIHLYVILSTQYPKDCVGPNIRNNLDLIFFNDLNHTAIEAVHKAMHINFNLREMINFVEEINDGSHTFICYDNNEKNKHARIKLVRAQMYDKIDMDFKEKEEVQATHEKNPPPQKPDEKEEKKPKKKSLIGQ